MSHLSIASDLMWKMVTFDIYYLLSPYFLCDGFRMRPTGGVAFVKQPPKSKKKSHCISSLLELSAPKILKKGSKGSSVTLLTLW